MAEPVIVPLKWAQFVICEDVRTEANGKMVLIGLYPGNIVIVPKYPHSIVCDCWSVVNVTVLGELTGRFRVLRLDRNETVFESDASFNVKVARSTMQMRFRMNFDVTERSTFVTEVKLGQDDWTKFGQFYAGTREDFSDTLFV